MENFEHLQQVYPKVYFYLYEKLLMFLEANSVFN